MSNLQEVATDDLLSFQDYTVPVHVPIVNSTVSVPVSQIDVSGNLKTTSAQLEGDMQQIRSPSRPADVPEMGGTGDANDGMTTRLILCKCN